MKKILEAGKLWTVLSTLLFFMTCGVFIVHATGSSSTGSFYNTYKTGAINNTLTDTGWNKLMEDLDNLIPEGAILAFTTNTCPDGWTRFTGADGRFLMGTNNTSEIGNRGGSGQIILRSSHLPPHQHYLRYGGDKAYDNPKTNYRSLVVDWNGGQYPWDPENTNYSMSHGAKSNSYYDVSTAPYGNGWGTGSNSNKPINIQNPYIKVLYCIKGNAPTGTDEDHPEHCPVSASHSSIYSCGEPFGLGWKFTVEQTLSDGTVCGKCVAKNCPSGTVICSSNNVNEDYVLGYSGKQKCVRIMKCCSDDAGDYHDTCLGPSNLPRD